MFVESMFVLDKMTTCGDRISIKYVRFLIFEAQIKWWFWFSHILQLQKTHSIRQIKNLFDVSKIMKAFNSLFISVACERCSALELSATCLVFPAVQWATFSVNIFFFVLLTLLFMIVSPPPIISLRSLTHLKEIIGSPSNILANFLLIFKIYQCFFMISETFWVDLL